jgi:MarR family transcriptional regulator for hemolysin
MFEFELIDTDRLYADCFHERYRQLSLTEYRTLHALAQNQGVSQSELARSLALHPVALGRILERLEEGRWAKRYPHPGDHRARLSAVTEKAWALLPVMRRIDMQLQCDALVGLCAEDRQMLMNALERMLASLRLCARAVT